MKCSAGSSDVLSVVVEMYAVAGTASSGKSRLCMLLIGCRTGNHLTLSIALHFVTPYIRQKNT